MKLALTPDEAAATLSVSRNFFDIHVKPMIPIVYKGKRVIVPVKSLEEWIDSLAERAV